jgi:hypothetical protein
MMSKDCQSGHPPLIHRSWFVVLVYLVSSKSSDVGLMTDGISIVSAKLGAGLVIAFTPWANTKPVITENDPNKSTLPNQFIEHLPRPMCFIVDVAKESEGLP